MRITKKGEAPSRPGPPEWFWGETWIDPIHDAEPPAAASSVILRFAPGARTAWHTHPLGQTLLITDGSGLVQTWGGPVQNVSAGDVVWIPPGEKHWHGAAPNASMAHVAIQEKLEGRTVDWLEHVSDEQYGL